MATMASPDSSQSLMAFEWAEVTITNGPQAADGGAATKARKNAPVGVGAEVWPTDTGRHVQHESSRLVQRQVTGDHVDDHPVGGALVEGDGRGLYPRRRPIGPLGQPDLEEPVLLG